MKLFIGVLVLLGIGGYAASKMPDEQRAKLNEAANKATSSVKDSKLGSTVTDKLSKTSDDAADALDDAVDAAGDVADAAGDQVDDAVDAAEDAVESAKS